MSMDPNVFGPIERMSAFIDTEDLLEGRFENNVDGNPIYIGYTPIVNAPTADAVWYIQFIEYDGEAIVRKRLPDDGPKFGYIWDNREFYFI